MELEYFYWEGHKEKNSIRKKLNRSIGQYTRYYKKIKIGISCNPERRKNEHNISGKGWRKMIILYKTTSKKYIDSLEKEVIDYHWDYVENEVSGGGGQKGVSPYYLYILIK